MYIYIILTDFQFKFKLNTYLKLCFSIRLLRSSFKRRQRWVVNVSVWLCAAIPLCILLYPLLYTCVYYIIRMLLFCFLRYTVLFVCRYVYLQFAVLHLRCSGLPWQRIFIYIYMFCFVYVFVHLSIVFFTFVCFFGHSSHLVYMYLCVYIYLLPPQCTPQFTIYFYSISWIIYCKLCWISNWINAPIVIFCVIRINSSCKNISCSKLF